MSLTITHTVKAVGLFLIVLCFR